MNLVVIVIEGDSLALSSVSCLLSLKGALKHGLFLRGDFYFIACLWKGAADANEDWGSIKESGKSQSY